MSECRDFEALFAPYVDGQAAPGQRASVDAHLERCRVCHQRVAAEKAAREVVVARRAVLRVCASDRLRVRCAAHSRHAHAQGAGRPGLLSRRTWLPLSLAATLLLAVAGVFLFGLNNPVDALAMQLALDHVKCFQSPPVRKPHVDAQAAEREWSARQGWSLRVPSSSPAVQLELRGVRRCLTTDGRVAHLMYDWRGQPLSVFVLPQTIRRDDGRPDWHRSDGEADAIVETFGHEAVIWSENGRTYVVLVKGRPSDLAPVVTYVKASARQP